MSRSVLVTGATGFVGKQILKSLQKKKVNITLVVRTGSQDKIQNKDGVIELFETEDLFSESIDWWATACKDIDTVIHVAWYAEPRKYLLSDKNIDCLLGTLNLARGASAAGVRRLVGIGTCFEYDLSKGMLSLDVPLRPTTLYAATKASTYLSLSQYLSQHNIEFAWCRLFYLYGEDEDERRLVSYIRSRLESNQLVELTSGNQIRDFMDVSEAGKVVVKIALDTVQGPVNICSGIPTTVRQLAEQIADEYGRRDLLRFGMRMENITDPPCVVGIKTVGLFDKNKDKAGE